MTTIVYLSPENLAAIHEGKAVTIVVTDDIRRSDQIVIRRDMSKEEQK